MNAQPPAIPSPSAFPPPTTSRLTGAGITVLILAWCYWLLLSLSYFADVVVALSGRPMQGAEYHSPSVSFTVALAGFSFFQVILLVLVRWLFLPFLVQPKRVQPGEWPASLLVLVAYVIIGALIKSIEVYGLVLWFGSISWPHYLGFAIPSAILMLAHAPIFVLTRRVMHRQLPPVPAGEAA